MDHRYKVIMKITHWDIFSEITTSNVGRNNDNYTCLLIITASRDTRLALKSRRNIKNNDNNHDKKEIKKIITMIFAPRSDRLHFSGTQPPSDFTPSYES